MSKLIKDKIEDLNSTLEVCKFLLNIDGVDNKKIKKRMERTKNEKKLLVERFPHYCI